jgi:hypothetical protein
MKSCQNGTDGNRGRVDMDCCEKQYRDIIQMLKKRADRQNVMSQSYSKGSSWDIVARELNRAIKGIEKVHAMGWLGKGV